MPVGVSPTPNPNAMKLVVGRPVGGPGTVTRGSDTEIVWLSDLLAIDDVVSVFLTADFVTITKSPSAGWDAILAEALPILETVFEV
ncbi:MAG: NifU N-terminal domain-containing protein [Actinobacteria bacterium]|nr:NifU N-terminal domain-containing protein [Actinomycetota bacterium]MCI0677731.1 NifU N-terminal domain-containing protein [Actinomycetota bacterium]